MPEIISSPFFSQCVQNSAFQVMSEGTLKAAGRPLFTLADKNTPDEIKKYSAVKEFTFQITSMILYAAAVVNIVQKGGYKLLSKMPVFKDMEVLKKCKTFKEFNKAFEANSSKIISEKTQAGADFLKRNREYALVKGAMEQTVMIGSGVILTILCPLLVSKLVHYVMPAFDKITGKKKKTKDTKLNNII